MKLLFASLVITSSLLFVSAATVISDWQDSAECKKNSTPVETTLCAGASTVLTYNDNAPAGNVLITLESHEVNDEGGIAWFAALRCGGGPCSNGNVRTNIKGNGTSWGVIYGPSGGSVNPNLSAGTYNIVLDADVYDSGGVGCTWFGDNNCSVIDVGDNTGGTLTVTNAASVNLNIGMLIDKLLDFFSL